MLLKDEQPLNAWSLIDITEDGINIFINDVQFLNTFVLIVFNEIGKTIFLREEHPSNALNPMESTDDGIDIWINDVQQLNA